MCLSPCFRLLRLYTAEQNSGSLEEIDALLGMGNRLFIGPGCLLGPVPDLHRFPPAAGGVVHLLEEAEMLCAHRVEGRLGRQLFCLGVEWLMGPTPNSHWN